MTKRKKVDQHSHAKIWTNNILFTCICSAHVLYFTSVREAVRGSCVNGKTKWDSVAFCSTGILLGCVSIFGFLCVGGGARLACCNFRRLHMRWWFSLVLMFDFRCCLCGHVPIGSGCLGQRVELQALKTNSASGEKSEEDNFDASSEDLLLGEQNQWCPLLLLCFHSTLRVLVKVLGVDSATRASETCVFAIFIAPVDSESQDKFFGVIKTTK